MDIHIEKLDPSHFEDVKGLIENYPFFDYRRYKSVKINKEYLQHHIKSAGENIICARVSGDLAGIISLKMLPWDSNLFGINMGKIEHIIVSPLLDPSIQKSVIKMMLQQASIFTKENEIQHISVKADTDDYSLIRELQKMDFYIADCLVTYINEINMKLPEIPSLFHIRPYQESDRERIIEISREAFENHIDRFSKDPYI
ncbi:MAG: hypothetical protein HZA00_09900, partial [Nitrospinae bacterium]|nr:hypothetical protein [Nitrospinota bacterium]